MPGQLSIITNCNYYIFMLYFAADPICPANIANYFIAALDSPALNFKKALFTGFHTAFIGYRHLFKLT